MENGELRLVLEENLSGYQVNQWHYESIMHKINGESTRISSKRGARFYYAFSYKKSVCIAMLVLLMLSVTALAATLLPSITQWLQERKDSDRLGEMSISNSSVTALMWDDMNIKVHTSASDGASFLCSVSFESKISLLVPYSGFVSDLDDIVVDNPDGKPITYVSINAICGIYDQEIYTAQYADDGTLYIMSEGLGDVASVPEMNIILKTVKAGKKDEKTLTVPLEQLPIVKAMRLCSPVRLGETGYVLESLLLNKTSLRTYVERNVVIDSQPLSYALKRPSVIIIDEQGDEVLHYWSYSDDMPLNLTVQVWSENRQELLYEHQLTKTDFEEVQ